MYCGYATRGSRNREHDHGPALFDTQFLPSGPKRPAGAVLHGTGPTRRRGFSAMKETRPNDLFKAWLALPEEQRKSMDAEFQDIFELSGEKGFRAFIDEASWQVLTALARGGALYTVS